MTRLWLDDVREPPDETWVWVRTVEAAKPLLAGQMFDECSLDHDLGLHKLGKLPDDIDEQIDLFQRARIEGLHEKVETGLDLVHWMIANDRVPARVVIHSWNPDGASAMAARLNYYGHDCFIDPYVPPKGRKV